MRKFILMNTSEFPCTGTHYLHAQKLARGFSFHGFQTLEATSTAYLSSLDLGPGDLVYLSNVGAAACIARGSSVELSLLSASKATPIFWFWHDHVKFLTQVFDKNWILTGEKWLQPDLPYEQNRIRIIQKSLSNFVPTGFASSLFPQEVGNLKRTDKYAAQFVGHKYYQRSRNVALRFARRGVRVRYTPPFLDESSRVRYFTDSRVTLGWHSPANAAAGNVVERVFEGLAFGSVVVSDNAFAPDATDGLAIYVQNLNECLEVIDKCDEDQEYFRKMQGLGYEWARSYGTYDKRALDFLTLLG